MPHSESQAFALSVICPNHRILPNVCSRIFLQMKIIFRALPAGDSCCYTCKLKPQTFFFVVEIGRSVSRYRVFHRERPYESVSNIKCGDETTTTTTTRIY